MRGKEGTPPRLPLPGHARVAHPPRPRFRVRGSNSLMSILSVVHFWNFERRGGTKKRASSGTVEIFSA